MSSIPQEQLGDALSSCHSLIAEVHANMRLIQRTFGRRRFVLVLLSYCLLSSVVLIGGGAVAQINVLTAHNDIARTGQNLNETILTPANVNPNQFGKLFTMRVDGYVYGQPLYVSQVSIPGKGTHNVVYLETDADSVFAFDADSNGGIDANPLWSVSLLTNTTPAGTLQSNFGVTGTPVIDLSKNMMYLVSSETRGSAAIFRLHAIDITTGAEKLGGPVQIQGSIAGTGNGSTGGVLAFDATYQYQRPGLLLLNGKLYMAIGSIADNGPYHGWIFSYNESTLQQINIYCSAPNGTGDGIWMSGSGLAAEVNNPAKPDGRMFISTANGTYSASYPYNNTMSLGMSIVDLDLTGGVMTAEDEFTPYNEAILDAQDGDVGSGGVVLLPTQTLGSGSTLQPLVQIGKSGAFYILNRNNLGGYNSAGDSQIVQEVQTPQSGFQNWGAGVWGSTAYWNGNIYSGGTNPGVDNSLTAYSFVNGQMSSTPTSQSAEKFGTPSPTPSISANGTQGGIVWAIDTNGIYTGGPQVLVAFDATNLAHTLYSTNSNLSRDNPGGAVKYTVPTIANGKVYVGAAYRLSVFGLLGSTPTAPPPVFTPPSATFTGSQPVMITDAASGAQIYYTTDGSTPSVSSTLYTDPITVTSSETVTAIASATGYLQSGPASAAYSSAANAANPVFSLAGGTYAGAQSLTITDGSPESEIHYTVDGSRPGAGSQVYTGPISLLASEEVVRALATAPGLLPSSIVAESYDITPVYAINFPNGFADAEGPIQFNGSTDLDDIRLQLTNGGLDEAGSAFYSTPVNIQSFTTDFTFQLSNPAADGVTFTIQNVGPTALGGGGGYLGYGNIRKSVAIKFDLFNNDGEGVNSTGLYLNGAAPTVPAINLTGTGIDLHSGDQIEAHFTYDGTILTMTLTDVVSLVMWSHSFAVNIPAIVGGNTAYVGFTGGTGGLSSSQKFTHWTYIAAPPSAPNYPNGFDTSELTLNKGAALSGTSLQLTNGGTNETTSAYFSTPVDVESFTTDFDFQLTQAAADGFTFVIQNVGPTALGGGGGYLGYGNIPKSVAIKFDIFNNDGEGVDSTGVYLNGAPPTVPASDLTSSGLELNSGDLIHAHISYDGTTLIWSLLDLTVFFPHHESFSASIGINIPHTIGSNTAYIGFTAASGGLTAIQNILDWTFTNP